MHIKSLVVSTMFLVAYAVPSQAARTVQSGVGANGMKWTATAQIVGVTSTGSTPAEGSPATASGGGNPIYLAPNRAGYSGVVGLLMTLRDGSMDACSGTLVGNRSVVTAAHCVSEGDGVQADIVRTQVFFYDDASSDRDQRFYDEWTGDPTPGVTAIDVSNYTIAPGYEGRLSVDQNDIAVLTLAEAAPLFAERYGIYDVDGNGDTVGSLKGKQFNVAGYGYRSDSGGDNGITGPHRSSTGFRRQGDNVFDFAWGDEVFDGFLIDEMAASGSYGVEYSYMADMDNGLAAQDGSCAFVQYFSPLSAVEAQAQGFCTTGVGEREVNTAPGDSGGGGFIDGKLASVTSYGMTMASSDLNGDINSGFGELAGFVPTFIHAKFIRSAIAAVPEPATWAQMLLGFGLIGIATRRHRRGAVVVA